MNATRDRRIRQGSERSAGGFGGGETVGIFTQPTHDRAYEVRCGKTADNGPTLVHLETAPIGTRKRGGLAPESRFGRRGEAPSNVVDALVSERRGNSVSRLSEFLTSGAGRFGKRCSKEICGQRPQLRPNFLGDRA
jgi:hypothetical protein